MKHFNKQWSNRNWGNNMHIFGQFWQAWSMALLLLLAFSGCGRQPKESRDIGKRIVFNDQQISSLGAKTIFFGHQSVGENIIQGVRDLLTQDPRLKLNIVSSDSPEKIAWPAFIEWSIGENEKPQSKDEAFRAIIEKDLGSQGAIAMYKYCYVDIGLNTNVQQMFENYRANVDALKIKYPKLKIVHITMPLRTIEPIFKAWAKAILGRPTSRELNYKRNLFNRLLRQAYHNSDPIYDLAVVESTHSDGSRSYFMRGNEMVFTLAPEFTDDGGHLNETGRRAAAEQLLLLLSAM